MYTSITWFRVKPGRDEDFKQAFVDAGMESRPWSLEGYQGIRMLQSHTDPGLYYVIGEWASEESYSQWRAIAQKGAPDGTLARLGDAIVEAGPGNVLSEVVLPQAK